MGRCEVGDDWRRVDAPDHGPSLRSPDAVSHNELLVLLIRDVNERNHEPLVSGTFVAQIARGDEDLGKNGDTGLHSGGKGSIALQRLRTDFASLN